MGSLVMTHAPDTGPHSYHHSMVDSDTDHEASEAAQPPQAPARIDESATPIPPAPPSPQPQPRDIEAHASSASSDGTITGPTPAATTAVPRPNQPYHPANINPHSRGLDQAGFPLTNDPRALQASPSSPRLQPHLSIGTILGWIRSHISQQDQSAGPISYPELCQ